MLIVDAYNVLHVTGVLPRDLAGPELGDLAAMIAASRYGASKAVLVCDGTRPRGGFAATGRLSVLYAGGGVEADERIEHLVSASTSPRRFLVVSGDRRVQTAARARRAAVLDSAEFLRRLAVDVRRGGALKPVAKPEVPLSAADTKAWLAEFGPAAAGLAAAAGKRDGDSAPPERFALHDLHDAGSEPAVVDRRAEEGPCIDESAAQQSRQPPPKAQAEPSRGRRQAEPDPELRRLIEEWRGRIDLDDLDMRRWLGETDDHVVKTNPPRRCPRRPRRGGPGLP